MLGHHSFVYRREKAVRSSRNCAYGWVVLKTKFKNSMKRASQPFIYFLSPYLPEKKEEKRLKDSIWSAQNVDVFTVLWPRTRQPKKNESIFKRKNVDGRTDRVCEAFYSFSFFSLESPNPSPSCLLAPRPVVPSKPF